jgi:DNA polymerase I-like protein with 3'-5' exonuclease and polymerase domains/uracil-DNA glycosylase
MAAVSPAHSRQVKVPAEGPQPAKILIVGEAPGKTDEQKIRPFSGDAGGELTRMLNEAGILRSETRITNVCKYRPPQDKLELWWSTKKKSVPGLVWYEGQQFDPRVIEGIEELYAEIEATNPNVIVPLGNLALWACTGNTGITKWRGSSLSWNGRKVIPTIHPSAILRKWDWRFLAVHDLRKVARESNSREYPPRVERFTIRPTFQQAKQRLEWLLAELAKGERWLAVDIETKWKTIACFGIAWSKQDAISIPFFTAENPIGYFSLDEEFEIIQLIKEVTTHPNARVIGQNWQYDYQYISRHWFFEVNLWLDIMSEHHVQFPGLPKGLDFQSSLYCPDHVYWKDEGKEQGQGSDDQWWEYNCRDCVRTFEIAEVLIANRKARPLKETVYGSPNSIQQRLSTPVARASLRGIRMDHKLRNQYAFELFERQAQQEQYLCDILGHPLNPRSSQQMHKLFYEDFKQQKILDRKTFRPTLDADALVVIGRREPILRPVCDAVSAVRSLGNLRAFCLQPLDIDGRFRSQLTIPGTETFRFASSADPLDYGTNAQNITSGNETDTSELILPNLRKLFIPDEGMFMLDFDLPQADARFVAWEAEDEALKEIFADPSRDMHSENAEIIFGRKPKSKDDIIRQQAKQGVHLTNYGGTPRVLAMTLGITVHEAERFQKRWFGAHPKIAQWHRRVFMEISSRRWVENIFGYRRFYFDRIDGLLKEALAWIPQSSVAVMTNLAILKIVENPDYVSKENVEFLLQVHDSSLFQVPAAKVRELVPRMLKDMTITAPYPDPLIMTPGVKGSDKSWGHCGKLEWLEEK